MVSLKFRTYKKAKSIQNELKGVTEAEAKVACLLALYLINNDKNITLQQFINTLPDTIWRAMEKYAIIVSGDKK